METLDQVHDLFEKQLGTKLGHPPKHGDVVLFTNPLQLFSSNNPMSARYYGLLKDQQDNILVVLHVWGEDFDILAHPSTVVAICDDRFFTGFLRCLRQIQARAIHDWQNFSESREGNRRTAANLSWAVQLGLVRSRLTDKMRHWELTDLGYALRRWLNRAPAAESSSPEASSP